ncbi:MAG: HigA family addiction module antidote protein [Candidatus Aminicenantes bacterium]|nr:HigA family addiction module antidote protein [Candidatus Aminicenantes bacterium]
MNKKKLPPIHPGVILLEEFLLPLGVSQYRLAKDINVPPRRINEIVHGKRAITADTALRLGRFFGTSPQFWKNLQGRYDIEITEDRLADRLNREVRSSINVRRTLYSNSVSLYNSAMSKVEKIRNQLYPLFQKDNHILFGYIFGSAAQGFTNRQSDIDVAVYLNQNLVKDTFEKRLQMIEKYQSILKKPVDVVILNEERSIFFKFVIIKEGKVVFERDHGQRVDFELRTMQEYYDYQPFLEAYNKAYIHRSIQESK